jgi:colanic acid/amylovoran biosynthesis protein
LTKHEIHDNVDQVADPTFIMDPLKPQGAGINIDEDVLGINLIPLMGKYLTGGALQKWEQTAAKIISAISKKTAYIFYRIPCVTFRSSNDITSWRNSGI